MLKMSKIYCNRYNRNLLNIFSALVFLMALSSCKKYLDQKTLPTLTVPSTLQDLQALLDNNNIMNYTTSPGLMQVFSDDYYVKIEDYQQNDNSGNYVWAGNAVDESSWNEPYTSVIYYANVVLDMLPEINRTDKNKETYDYIHGASLFYRSFAFLQLAQVYCKTYSTTADADLGIVLRLTSAVGKESVRNTVKQTYDQIVNDLKLAAELLPDTTSFYYRPNKIAAYGTLARTFLVMGDFPNAKYYADLALQTKNELLDYNTIAPASTSNPFLNRYNPEVIFYNTSFPNPLLAQTVAIIDSSLYQSYNDNDLRKAVFFRLRNDEWRFKGSYAGSAAAAHVVFDGIAVDELYLIRAECYAKEGLVDEAMEDLNKLLRKRWVDGSFSDLIAINAEDARSKILQERRKELVFRGLRWSDIRRLNNEGENIVLKRDLDGTIYSLPPNDLRYVALIPWDEVNLSGLQQNAR